MKKRYKVIVKTIDRGERFDIIVKTRGEINSSLMHGLEGICLKLIELGVNEKDLNTIIKNTYKYCQRNMEKVEE